MHSDKKCRSVLWLKGDKFNNIRTPFYIFFLNPDYVAVARSLRSLRSKNENRLMSFSHSLLLLQRQTYQISFHLFFNFNLVASTFLTCLDKGIDYELSHFRLVHRA